MTAIGTWFGALGGLLAVGAAIATVRSSERNRLEDARKAARSEDERLAEEAAAAGRVHFDWLQRGRTAGKLSSVVLRVSNDNTNVSVFRARAESPTLGRTVGVGTLPAGKTEQSGTAPMPGLSEEPVEEILARMNEESTLTYIINDVAWRRVGRREPERI